MRAYSRRSYRVAGDILTTPLYSGHDHGHQLTALDHLLSRAPYLRQQFVHPGHRLVALLPRLPELLPPESSIGRCPARSASPIIASASKAAFLASDHRRPAYSAGSATLSATVSVGTRLKAM